MHYERFRKHGSPQITLKGGTPKKQTHEPCIVDGCTRWMVAKGLCHMHYLIAHRKGDLSYAPCSIDACEKPSTVSGMCDMHYQRFKKYGDAQTVKLVRNPSAEHKRAKAMERTQRYRATTHGMVRSRWARGKKRVETGWIIPGVTKAQLLALWSQPRCGICGGEIDDTDKTIDHIIPIAKGGVHVLGNLQIAHKLCNQRKRDRVLSTDEFRALYP